MKNNKSKPLVVIQCYEVSWTWIMVSYYWSGAVNLVRWNLLAGDDRLMSLYIKIYLNAYLLETYIYVYARVIPVASMFSVRTQTIHVNQVKLSAWITIVIDKMVCY